MIDDRLREWATPRQIEYIDAVNLHGSATAAARVLGVSRGALRDGIARLKLRAAAQGYSPSHDLTHAIPAPFIARGHSTYYDRDGKAVQQWVKTRLDDTRYQEMIAATAQALADDLPRRAPLPAPEATQGDLANLYVLTDVHLGMLAWHKEGGANWDLKIAESTVTNCFLAMMDRSPAAHTGIVAQLGDWFHSDGMVPVTPTSGHVLDQDGRYAKMVAAGVRLARRVIDEALRRHERVIVLMAEGNHDMASSIWMQTLFAALYENEPRIEVVQTPLPYYAIKHGRTALFFHHGHKKKLGELPLLFAAMFPDAWGGADRRYAHTGHLHHLHEKEHPGLKLLQHPTIAARDAHAARGGWISERQAMTITYSSRWGEVGRTVVTPEMLP